MIDSQLALTWLGIFRPPPVIAPSAFAEAEIVLPSSANSIPGPLRLASYQKELVDSIAAEGVEVIVLQLSSQVGKSLSVDAMLAHCIANDPGPSLHVSPTGQRAVEFVRDRFDPLIGASPTLRKLIGTGQDKRKGADSISAKSFPAGSLNFASSFKPDELAARAIKYLFLDEVDRFAISAGCEGSPVALAIKRTKTFEGKGRRVVIVSTPTNRASRIHEWYLRGDQRKFFVACADCGHNAPLAFENLKWTESQPSTAHLVCESCGCIHNEAHRRAMLDLGKWEATAVGEPGVRSYHLTELSSKFSTLASVAAQYDAAKTPEQKQAFFNTCLAQTYEAGTEVELSASELQQRAEPIAAPYANNIEKITAGVDVQSNRLECTYLAHRADGTFIVLNHVKLFGDTSGTEVWNALDNALGEVFTLANGRKLTVQATAVDSGFSADRVMAFVNMQRRKSRACYAVKGRGGFERMPLTWGGNLKGQMRLLIVGVDAVKHTVQRHLALQSIEPGYIRLPSHLPQEYFKGLASEELRVRYVKGAPKYEYHRTFRQNEPLDTLVYATAIANTVPKVALTPPPSGPDVKHWAAKLNAAHNNH
jgi:phage terminase large subunit GpA-like protein